MKFDRTAITAAASVVAILTAGSAALAANFGILSNDDHNDSLTSTPTIVASQFENDDSSTSIPTSETVAYQVPGVGVVTLYQEGDELKLVSVDADPAWTWTVDDEEGDHQGNEDGIRIRFVSDTTIVVFTAYVQDGQVVVDATEEPVVTTTSTSTTSTTMDDHQDDDMYEQESDDAYEQESDHSTYESGDDEHEGGHEREDD